MTQAETKQRMHEMATEVMNEREKQMEQCMRNSPRLREIVLEVDQAGYRKSAQALWSIFKWGYMAHPDWTEQQMMEFIYEKLFNKQK